MVLFSAQLLVYVFPVLFCSAVGQMTCGGCEFEENRENYYCTGTERSVYFRCISKSGQLIWNVSPMFREPVVLNGLNEEDNVIRQDNVTIFVDTVTSTSGEVQIISYLWLDVGLFGSELTVECDNGERHNRVFKPIGNSEVLSLEQVYVVTQQHVVTQQTSMDGNVVFYAWNHENFKGLLCYFIKTYLNDTLISNISMPRESVNGSHNIPNNMYGQLRVEVEAVDLCYGRVSRDKTIRYEDISETNCEVQPEIEQSSVANSPTPVSSTDNASNGEGIAISVVGTVKLCLLSSFLSLLLSFGR